MPTPIEQLLSQTRYTTDGSTTTWDFSFADGYLDKSHIKAYTEDANFLRAPITVTTGMVIGAYQLLISPALAAGLTLVIYRDTPKDAPLVNFADGGSLSEVALDTMARQSVMVAAEATDQVNTAAIQGAIEAANDVAISQSSAAASAASASSSAASAGSSAASASSSAASASSSAASAASSASVVSTNIAAINTVSANIAGVNTTAANVPAILAAPAAAVAAGNSQTAAEAAAAVAQQAAGSASFAILQGLGFTASTAYDYGYVSDVAVAHPTDYGTL